MQGRRRPASTPQPSAAARHLVGGSVDDPLGWFGRGRSPTSGRAGRGDASSAAAAPCDVGAQTHTGAQGRGPSTLCSASPNGTEHHRAEWLSVMAELGRRGGRHDRFNGVSGRFGPTYGVYRQIGPRATPSQRCRGAGTAPVVPGQPPQPHTARHSRRSVRDARNDYRCARASAQAWAQRRGVPRRSRGEADAPSAADGAPLRSGAPVEPALVRSGPFGPAVPRAAAPTRRHTRSEVPTEWHTTAFGHSRRGLAPPRERADATRYSWGV